MTRSGTHARAAAVVALTLAAAGCQLPPGGAGSGFQALPGGTLENAGAVIEEPGVFRIAGGQNFTTPFSVDCTQLNPSVNGWQQAVAAGAHRVLITLHGQPRTFGGVLALCRIDASATGPSSRAYSLVIPDSRVAQAQDGLIATVAEKVTVNRAAPLNLGALLLHAPGQPAVPANITEDYAWMLWLTDRPSVLGVSFASAAPAPAPHGGPPVLVKGAVYSVVVSTRLKAAASKSSATLETLDAGSTVTATGARHAGYWNVTAADGQTGWVAPRALSGG